MGQNTLKHTVLMHLTVKVTESEIIHSENEGAPAAAGVPDAVQ